MSKAEDNFVREYIHLLHQGDFKTAKTFLDPEIQNNDNEQALKNLTNYFDQKELIKVELVKFQIVHTSTKEITSFAHQLEFLDEWVLIDTIVHTIKDKPQIYNYRVTSLPESLQQINAFAFSEKSLLHYGFLIFVPVIFLFIFYTLRICLRTNIKRRWLWILCIIIGFGQIALNWTTGELEFRLLNLQFFGVGLGCGSVYDPWFFKISLPIGAILFFLRYFNHPRLNRNSSKAEIA